MFKFTKTGIFCIISVITFCLLQILIHQFSIETEMNQEIMEGTIVKFIPAIETKEKIDIWQIEIPKISLIANITEGTTKEVLNQYVGHFGNTSIKEGNIGLAAYNGGYNVNYFKNLKNLKQGDEIKYKYNEFEKIYEVEKNRIIKHSEWEYLDETEDNMLTLITYVENQPEYRRCIQAVEKEDEILVYKF